MPTYKDLCVTILLRMGEDKNVSDNEIVNPGAAATAGYLKAVPVLLREGLTLLLTGGRHLVKSLGFTRAAGEPGRFDLAALAPDFFSLAARPVVKDGEVTPHYRLEGERYLVLGEEDFGAFTLYYNAYPPPLPDPLPDGYVIPAGEEVYAPLLLYVEGKLRQMFDEENAAVLLNEFEQRKAELYSRQAAANLAPAARVTLPKRGAAFW